MCCVFARFHPDSDSIPDSVNLELARYYWLIKKIAFGILEMTSQPRQPVLTIEILRGINEILKVVEVPAVDIYIYRVYSYTRIYYV